MSALPSTTNANGSRLTNQIVSKQPLLFEMSVAKIDGDEWYTPSQYIEAARRVLGQIDLDPASCEVAQQVVKATHFLTKQDDSLRDDVPWHGRVWLNPPYSIPSKFVSKLIAQYEEGNVTEAILLTNNCTETGWCQSLFARYPACFTRGRVVFWHSIHKGQSPRQGQIFFYLGNEIAKFADEFRQFGLLIKRLE